MAVDLILTMSQFFSKAKSGGSPSKMLVLGNQAADLDSFVSALALSLLLGPEHTAIINCNRIHFPLRTEITWLLSHLSYAPPMNFIDDERIMGLMNDPSESIILVDFNALPNSDRVVQIYDHHHDEEMHKLASPRVITNVGSCTTLIAELYQAKNIHPEEKLARLMCAAILLDTVNLDPAYNRVTDRDLAMFEYLDRGSVGDQTVFFQNIERYVNEGYLWGRAKADIGHLNTGQLLIKDYKQWDRLGISSVTGLSLEANLTAREGFQEAIDALIKDRDLSLFCLMTGCNHGYDRGFERELLLFGKDARRVAELIREELKLEEAGESIHLMFNQRNLSARYGN